MYVIIVYDVEQKRVTKVMKFLRRFLTWVQNSVFEGETTEAKFKEIQMGLKKLINKDKDSIVSYQMESEKNFKRSVLGLEKNPTDTMI
jgi:CRISPR-associated protein Cas2